MKNKYQIKLFLIMVAAICFGSGLPSAAQDKKRQRVIAGPTPTPTPAVVVTPTPPPVPTPTATPTPAASQTLFDLQSRIRQTLLRPELRRGSVGVKITSLDTGQVVFEDMAEKYFMPASNMKNFTVAAALERLSPDFRFVTSVYADSQPDLEGRIKGDLTVYGRGDVSISTNFNNGDYYKGIDALVDRIVQAGVKRVEGNLIADDSYFSGYPIPPSWEWDDLQWYYGAEVSALPVNDNALDLSIRPGTVGESCIVLVSPFNPVMKIVNRCLTTAAGTRRDLTVRKDLDQNVLEIFGSLPVGDNGFKNYVTVSRPAELFVWLLRQRLESRGVAVTGQTRVIGTREKALLEALGNAAPVEIARLESPPLSLIAAKTMKPSQNLYTETLLWTLGEYVGDKSNPRQTSAQRGIAVVQNFLQQQVGLAPDSIIQWDGSGLSRHNLVTPASIVQLYTYMARQSRYRDAWMNSLTIGAVDGTLQNRFKGTKAAGNVRGKTGTIDQVSALSGYVTTASGERIIFAILVNGVGDVRQRVSTIDEIVSHLANFNGRLN